MTNLNNDLESVIHLFNSVKIMKATADSSIEDENRMTLAFETHCKSVSERLGDRLVSLEPYQRSTEILMAKHGLYDVCFQEVIAFCEQLGAIDLAKVLRQIRAVHTVLFQSVPPMISSITPLAEKKFQAEISDMKLKMAQSDLETNQLLEAAEMLEVESKNKDVEILRLRGLLRQQQQQQQQQQPQPLSGRKKKITVSPPPETLPPQPASKSISISISKSHPPTPPQTPKPPKTPSTNGEAIRQLTLKQLTSFIADLYKSKIIYDKKCASNKLPRETTEQHLYTYLNQRYGLRKLIVANAAAVVKAVAKFKEEDNFVATFDRIMNNQIDEEFR